MRVYVKITNNCNMSCPFCYNPKIQDICNVNKINDYLDRLNKNDKVIFHGGEPMLYPSIIDNIIDCHPDLHYSITTNLCYSLTEEKTNVLLQCDLATSYSADRFKDDFYFKLFKDNVNLLSDFKPITLLVTLSENQLKVPAAELAQIINSLKVKNISFERLYLKDYDKKDLYIKTDNYLCELFGYIDKNKNNLYKMMKRAYETGMSVYPTACDAVTLETDCSIFGCPNHVCGGRKKKKLKECLECKFYQYCRGDCPSFSIETCNFPKNTFERWIINNGV